MAGKFLQLQRSPLMANLVIESSD